MVVPEKMQKFYEDTQIPADPYPWQGKSDMPTLETALICEVRYLR